MKFVLEINLGNEAMQTPSDVAQALVDVTKRIRERVGMELDGEWNTEVAAIFDENGNRVGFWSIGNG